MLRTHGLAISAIAYQTIVHGLCDWKADRVLYGMNVVTTAQANLF